MSFVWQDWFVPTVMQSDLLAAISLGMNALGVSTPPNLPASATSITVDVIRNGTGAMAQNGDRVTVHFVVRTAEGKEIANSIKRGMPFSLELADPGSIWTTALDGVRVGGATRVTANSSLFFGRSGVLPVVPPDTMLHAYVSLLKVEKAMLARRTETPSKAGQR